MTTLQIPIGLLFSTDGPYAAVSASMLAGAFLAIEEVNADDRPFRFTTQLADPHGELSRYAALGEALLASGIRHVVGCYTSSSRKEIIPLFEKANALLWYPSHYEGFESSSNVVYTGPVANQHLLPLVDYLVRYVGRTVFCVGSNYIWAWENNRVMRESLAVAGGMVTAERYFAVGATDFAQTIAAILAERPSFVFNTLIGVSSYRFVHDLRTACLAMGLDQPTVLPIASCTLSEPELEAIGPGAMDGHITASVYFASIISAENARFTAAYRSRYPEGPAVSADAEATYVAVKLLAQALAASGTDEIGAVRSALARQVLRAPQGEVRIDPDTMHATLTPRIGRSNRHGQFDILAEAPHPVRADPYLIDRRVAPQPPRQSAPAQNHITGERRLVQNFRGLRGILSAGPDFDADMLDRTLLKLGVTPVRLADVEVSKLDRDRDILFLDGDQPFASDLAAAKDSGLPLVPTIGIVGSEAPSRMRLLAEAGATAFLRKPVHGATVYSALYLGVNTFRRIRAMELSVTEGKRRLNGRRFIIKAVIALVQSQGLDDDEAFAQLRRESMRCRQELEEFCEALLKERDGTTSVDRPPTPSKAVLFDPTERDDPSHRDGDGQHAGAVGADGHASDGLQRPRHV